MRRLRQTTAIVAAHTVIPRCGWDVHKPSGNLAPGQRLLVHVSLRLLRLRSRRLLPQFRTVTGLERTFEAVVNMALFLQREAVRNALQRQKPLTKDSVHDPKQRLAQLVCISKLRSRETPG